MGNAGVNINTYMKSFKKFLMEKGNQFKPYGYWRDFKIGEDGRIYYFDEPHDLDEPLPQEDWEVFNPNEAPTPYPTDLGVVYGLPGSETFTPPDWTQSPDGQPPITPPANNIP